MCLSWVPDGGQPFASPIWQDPYVLDNGTGDVLVWADLMIKDWLLGLIDYSGIIMIMKVCPYVLIVYKALALMTWSVKS